MSLFLNYNIKKETTMSDKGCFEICCDECKDTVIPLSKGSAILCLILNVLASGSGTMFSSSTCCNKEKFACLTLAMGFCQWSGGIVGWVWSIMYGLDMVKKAKA